MLKSINVSEDEKVEKKRGASVCLFVREQWTVNLINDAFITTFFHNDV